MLPFLSRKISASEGMMSCMTSNSLRCASSLRLQLAGPTAVYRFQETPSIALSSGTQFLSDAKAWGRGLAGSSSSEYASGAQLLPESTGVVFETLHLIGFHLDSFAA